MRAVAILFISFALLMPAASARQTTEAVSRPTVAQASKPAAKADAKPGSSAVTEGTAAGNAEFDRARVAGNDAVYNMDYAAAREYFTRMTQLAPDHPAGYVYLANNMWLELLNQNRRLTTSTYTGGSFYEKGKQDDEVDPKLDREFGDLIKKALTVTQVRLRANRKDAEALYYQASALGLRAGWDTTVTRSFVRAIGDANESIKIQKEVLKADPNYVDAYLSIGLYEYVLAKLPFGWRMLTRMAGLSGSQTKGIEHLELVTQQGKYAADDARVLLIGIYAKENQLERSLELISLLAAKYPRNYLFGVERGAMFYRLNRTKEGARVFSELLENARIAGQATDLVNYQWGESLAARGDHAAAVERFNAVAKWPKSDAGLISMAHLRAGQSLDVLGNREAALAEYQTVLKRENVYDSHKQASQGVKKPFVPQKS